MLSHAQFVLSTWLMAIVMVILFFFFSFFFFPFRFKSPSSYPLKNHVESYVENSNYYTKTFFSDMNTVEKIVRNHKLLNLIEFNQGDKSTMQRFQFFQFLLPTNTQLSLSSCLYSRPSVVIPTGCPPQRKNICTLARKRIQKTKPSNTWMLSAVGKASMWRRR